MKKQMSILVLIMLMAATAFAIEYPKPTSWVNDYARVLTNNQKQELDVLLKDFETATTNQIFVCIMSNLPAGTTLEEYVNELFARWKPGTKGKDNGVVLAIFINDRKLRIETGYELEANLTDAASKLIIANDITPSFKQGNYYQGIKNGIIGIMRTIKADYKPQPTSGKPRPTSNYEWQTVLWIIIVIVFILFRILAGGRRSIGWSYGSSRGWHSHSHRRSGGWGGSSSGRSGGFFGGGSSSSSGGFSGGHGGSSGGGGASGSW